MHGALGVFHRVHGDGFGGQQSVIAFKTIFCVKQFGFKLGLFGYRFLHSRPVARILNFEQEIPLLHDLSFPETGGYDVAGDAGLHSHPVNGFHLADVLLVHRAVNSGGFLDEYGTGFGCSPSRSSLGITRNKQGKKQAGTGQQAEGRLPMMRVFFHMVTVNVVVKGIHNTAEILLVLLRQSAEQGIQFFLHAVEKHLEPGFAFLGKADAQGTPVAGILLAVEQAFLHHAVHQQGGGGNAHAEIMGKLFQGNAFLAVGHQVVQGTQGVHLPDGKPHDFLVMALVHLIQVIPFELVKDRLEFVNGGCDIRGSLKHGGVMSKPVNCCQTKTNKVEKLLLY